MPTLKHNKTIRVKPLSAPIIKIQKTIASLKHQLKPIAINLKATNIRPKVRAVSSKRGANALIVPHRITRQLPNTRLRGVKSVHSAPGARISGSEAIKKLRSIGTNKILIIVGNGPSHREAELDKLLKYPFIDFMSINRPDERVWPTRYWLFCDNSQQKRHKGLWSTYNGSLINSSAIKESKPNTTLIRSLHGKGFSLDLTKGMYIGRSSVYAAIQVGIWMGYKHIYVFGCDMTAVDGKLYPWGTNPDVADTNRSRRFKYEAEHYGWMAENTSKDLKRRITFCTKYNPWPFMKAFEQMDHIEAVDLIPNKYNELMSQ